MHSLTARASLSLMTRQAPRPAGLGPALFLPWAAWTCVWAAVFILLLSVAGACSYISRFTRFAGELFGGLIAVGGRTRAPACPPPAGPSARLKARVHVTHVSQHGG